MILKKPQKYSMINNLIFGTAKMGIKGYTANSQAKVADNSKLLDYLIYKGVTRLDTAERYGESHDIIADYNLTRGNQFLISTKIDSLTPKDKNVSKKLIEFTTKTIERLNIEMLDILYLHQNDLQIISDPYIIDGLKELKSKKLISKTGISIYEESELEFGLDSEWYDCIQFPLNIYDSFLYDKYISNYDSKRIKFIARSIFFRGYLFNNNISNFKKFMDFPMFFKINQLIKDLDIDLSYLTMSFLKEKTKLDSIIFSSSSIENINKIISFNNAKKIYIPEEIITLSSKYKTWGDLRKI